MPVVRSMPVSGYLAPPELLSGSLTACSNPKAQTPGSRFMLALTALADGPRAADLQGQARQAPSVRPTIVPAPETAMASDPGAWVPVVLWLQVLVAGSVAAAWAQVRWGGAQVWPACAPVILAGLRGAGDSIIQLLAT